MKMVKKIKKIKKKSNELSVEKKISDAFDLFHSWTVKYKGQNIDKAIEGEDLTLRETACLMLGFSLGGKETK